MAQPGQLGIIPNRALSQECLQFDRQSQQPRDPGQRARGSAPSWRFVCGCQRPNSFHDLRTPHSRNGLAQAMIHFIPELPIEDGFMLPWIDLALMTYLAGVNHVTE